MRHFIIEGHQLTGLDSRYYYLNGKFCPSVSTILEAYPKGPEFYKWLKETGEESDKIRDAAGVKGSNVHKMTEHYDEGLEVSLLDMSGYQQWSFQEWSLLSRYVEFRNATSPTLKIHAREMQLVDMELLEAGTLDMYCEIDGKHLILDIKTSNSIYPSYWLQLAAYRRLFERSSGQKIDGVGIIWLNAKTRGQSVGKIQGRGWQLLMREDSTNDLKLFEATKLLWLAQNEGAVPNNVSYQISFQQPKP